MVIMRRYGRGVDLEFEWQINRTYFGKVIRGQDAYNSLMAYIENRGTSALLLCSSLQHPSTDNSLFSSCSITSEYKCIVLVQLTPTSIN
jgi:hypothetical protein